jgi:hypothetical protein
MRVWHYKKRENLKALYILWEPSTKLNNPRPRVLATKSNHEKDFNANKV